MKDIFDYYFKITKYNYKKNKFKDKNIYKIFIGEL